MAKKKKSAPQPSNSDVDAAIAVIERTDEDEHPIEETSTPSESTDESTAELTPPKPQNVTTRCEEAKELGACACRCRGRYHGHPHPDGWKDEEGCEPLNEAERKMAKKDTLNAWRRAHKERVKAYMEQWRATSNAPTALQARAAAEKRAAKGEAAAAPSQE